MFVGYVVFQFCCSDIAVFSIELFGVRFWISILDLKLNFRSLMWCLIEFECVTGSSLVLVVVCRVGV